MLEIVREFALEMLLKTGEIDDLQRLHAGYFLLLAEEADPFLQSDKCDEWLKKLENEHDNLRAALAWSLKNAPETLVRLAAALRYFWLDHCHHSEGFWWSTAAMQVSENVASEARSKLMLANGLFLKKQGQFDEARKVYEKILAENREAKNLSLIVMALNGLASNAVLQKDAAAAQIFLEEALAVSRKLNDEMLLAYTLCSLGDFEMSRENPVSARPLLDECLTLSKKLGNKRLLSNTYLNLGIVYFLENEYDAAALKFSESLQTAQAMDDKKTISYTLDGFAALAAKSGNAEQSAKLAGAAETLRESVDYQIEPAEEIFREKYMAATRAALAPKDFTAAYKIGRSLDFSESIALTKIATFDFSDAFGENVSEIIIETRQISRIIIEKEIEN